MGRQAHGRIRAQRLTTSFVLCAAVSVLSSMSTSAMAQPTVEEVAEQTQPAVVAVISRQSVGTRLGSGFFIAPDLLVTNKQFLENDAKVTLADAAGRRLKAVEVMGVSVDYDLALIRVSTEASAHLTVSNRSVEKKQAIYLVGAPLRGRSTYSTGKIVEVGDTGVLMRVTAKVTQRNSGAPILDSSGYVVGVATRTPSMKPTEHFAVPADHLSDLLAIHLATTDESALDVNAGMTPDPGAGTDKTGTKTGSDASTTTTPEIGADATGAKPGALPVAKRGGWMTVAAFERDLVDETRRAQLACGYNEQALAYGCDPNQLKGFAIRSEVQSRPPQAEDGRTAQADLLYDKNGCASHIRVRIGSTLHATDVDWGRGTFIIGGRAVTSVQTLQAPGVRLEAPMGSVAEETLRGGGVPCLLTPEASEGPSLTFRVPARIGETETLLSWDFRRQYMRSDVTEYAALRLLPPPPAVADPGAAPLPPEEGGLTGPVIGAAIGIGLPLIVAAVVGVVASAAFASNGDVDGIPNFLLGVAIVGGGAALAGGVGGLFMGLFASRGSEEDQAAEVAGYRAALANWQAQRRAFVQRQVFDRALQGLHGGAAAPQVREVPLQAAPPTR